jgi:hypothetical protein
MLERAVSFEAAFFMLVRKESLNLPVALLLL